MDEKLALICFYFDGLSHTYWYKYVIVYLVFQRGCLKKSYKTDAFLAQKIVLITANSAVPEKCGLCGILSGVSLIDKAPVHHVYRYPK